MPPVVFKHFHDPNLGQDHYHDYYDHRKRHKGYDYRDDKRKRNYDEDSAYGETVYDFESIYTVRSDTPPPRRHHRHHRHQNHRRPHRHGDDIPDNYGHHHPHIHYTSPRSEPPVRTYGGHQPQQMEVAMLKALPEPQSEPRIALYARRHRKHQGPHGKHCNCFGCPEKSSKTIPSMHYDELRCQYCAAHVQPSQDEILAYPWTVISYRPNRKTKSDANISLPPLQPSGDDFSMTQQTITKKPPTTQVSKSAKSRQKSAAVADDKENESLVAPSQPLFRSNNDAPARADFSSVYLRRGEDTYRTDRDFSEVRRGEGTYLSQRKTLSRVTEDAHDDVRPIDSISNVDLPPLRAHTNSYVRNYYRPRHTARAEMASDVDVNYTREKYFRSLETQQRLQQQHGAPPLQALQHQPMAMPTPRPARDTASQISRMLKGQYYDRQNGQKYTYNVNYGRRSIVGERRPNG